MTGLQRVTCFFDHALACTEVVPRGITRGFRQAGALARRAAATVNPVKAQRLFRQVDRKLARVTTAIDKAMVRRKTALSASCGTALHAIVDEALTRVRGAES